MKPESVNLPPMQINALPASTVSRLDTLSIDEEGAADNANSTSGGKRPLPVPPRSTKLSRVAETTYSRGTLPTITGSPSVIGAAASASIDAEASGGHLGISTSPKPATPTRIPRLTGSKSNGNSPQPQPAPRDSVSPAETGESATDLPYRRGSLAPGSGFSSSVPQQASSFLSARLKSNPGTPSSSDSGMQGSPLPSDQAGSSSENGLSRQTSATYSASRLPESATSASRVPSSSKASSFTAATSKSERRRSFLPQQEEREGKVARTPLKSSLPALGSRVLSSKAQQPLSPPTSSTGSISGIARIRNKTSDGGTFASSGKGPVAEGLLPTSKSTRSLASKLSIPSRVSKSANASSLSQSPAPSEVAGERSTSSSRYGTPIGEDEIRGDEEMVDFLRRQRTKKSSAHGLSSEEIDRMLDFPEPIEPQSPLLPAGACRLLSLCLTRKTLTLIRFALIQTPFSTSHTRCLTMRGMRSRTSSRYTLSAKEARRTWPARSCLPIITATTTSEATTSLLSEIT